MSYAAFLDNLLYCFKNVTMIKTSETSYSICERQLCYTVPVEMTFATTRSERIFWWSNLMQALFQTALHKFSSGSHEKCRKFRKKKPPNFHLYWYLNSTMFNLVSLSVFFQGDFLVCIEMASNYTPALFLYFKKFLDSC